MHTLETKLGYVFHRPGLLENALYHSSYANEHRGAGICSNERLEFLGDAVLGFVTAEYLYTKHPDMPEGDLTRIRAALVARRVCTRWPSIWVLASTCGWAGARSWAAAAAVRPFWRTPRSRCLPPSIWMAAWTPPAT